MPTVHFHRQYPGHNSWKIDINYRHTVTSCRTGLLVADPRLTFLWNKAIIYFAEDHCETTSNGNQFKNSSAHSERQDD